MMEHGRQVLADALADVGTSADITANEEQAIAGCHDSATRVVITGINRRGEDIKGMNFGRAMRAQCPFLSVVYLAALWPVALREDLRRSLVDDGVRKIEAWTERHGIALAEWSDTPVDPFFNVNSPEDVARAEQLARG